MDFERWYRKAQRRATAMQWQAGVLALLAIVLGAFLKSVAAGAPDIVKPIFEVFMWAPRLCAVGALALFAIGAWNAWRLHHDPVALHEGR
ncbi:hypothetical protein [Lysobacter sp. GCM10012299]|uniref:hypothetical protein n=1 Tax=Lysobacter sp. GCM10012299 TaxID=3317333 RepID=UPI003616529F